MDQKPIETFWDVIRHPEIKKQLELEGKVPPDPIGASEIDQKIEAFVFPANSPQVSDKVPKEIEALGALAYPKLLEILSDRSLHSRLATIEQTKSSKFAPITRICSFFDSRTLPPPGIGPLLSPFLESESDEIRKKVASVLGSIGSVDLISDFQKALKDKVEHVRSNTLRGLEKAISENRITPESKEPFFDLISERFPTDTEFTVIEKLPRILLKLDPQRGRDRLLQADVFSPHFHPAYRILQAFSETRVEIPREKVLGLIHETQQLPMEYPLNYVMSEALSLLGGYRDKQDLPLLNDSLKNPNKEVVKGAVRGLTRFYPALENKKHWGDVLSSPDWNSLPAWEKQMASIELLDCEVKNGGFSQFYFNSSGDFWKEAYAGLKAIGANGHYSLMAETLARFPNSSPSVETDPRNQELAKIAQEGDDPFSNQDSAWYALKEENLEFLIFQFQLAILTGNGK